MRVSEGILVAFISLFGILLTGLLADVAIWRRSLARDVRDFATRIAVIENTLKLVFPRQHHRAQDETQP